MGRISLDLQRIPHPPAETIGYPLAATRILAHVALQGASGWTRYRPGIVDTGAAVSLFPAQVWRDAEHRFIGMVRIGGIVQRDECRVAARLAAVTCALSDGLDVIGPLTVHAYLAESDEVPLLLGVCELIESGRLTVAIGQGLATFEK